jgi:SAM-dependent methyltransferase
MDHVINTDQADYWNAAEARHWVDHDRRYDRMLRPFNHHLFGAADIRAGAQVLDVGCGCGHTARAAARRVAPGKVVGVDLSGPMLDQARRAAAEEGIGNVRFEQADAQAHAFEPQVFDAAISRFGVMFFADPVTAFANIGGALRDDGRLAFVCWRGFLENEWISVPAGAVVQHVPLPDLGDPTAPGPFAFADGERVAALLGAAGFADVAIEPVSEPLWLGADVDDAIAFIRGTGFAQMVLDPAPPDAVARAVDAARGALEPFASDGGVILGSSSWLVRANR